MLGRRISGYFNIVTTEKRWVLRINYHSDIGLCPDDGWNAPAIIRCNNSRIVNYFEISKDFFSTTLVRYCRFRYVHGIFVGIFGSRNHFVMLSCFHFRTHGSPSRVRNRPGNSLSDIRSVRYLERILDRKK